jgi:hypothetical protein
MLVWKVIKIYEINLIAIVRITKIVTIFERANLVKIFSFNLIFQNF